EDAVRPGREVDAAHASPSQQLLEPIRTDAGARGTDRPFGAAGGAPASEKGAGLAIGLEQLTDLALDRRVAGAFPLQEGRPPPPRPLRRLGQPAARAPRPTPDRGEPRRATWGYTQPRAARHGRPPVPAEQPPAAPASSTVSPPKKRSSTREALTGSRVASVAR